MFLTIRPMFSIFRPMRDKRIPYGFERLADGRIKITFHGSRAIDSVSVTVDDLGFDQFLSEGQHFRSRENEESRPRLRVVS